MQQLLRDPFNSYTFISSNTHTMDTIEYRGYKINAETDEWALKSGWLFNYRKTDEHIYSGFTTVEECKNEIDERINVETNKTTI